MGGVIILLAFFSSCLSTVLSVEKNKEEYLSPWHEKDDGDLFDYKYKDILDVLTDDDDDDQRKSIFTTKDPFDFWKPWERFTLPPRQINYDYLLDKQSDHTGIYFAVFVIVFIVLVAVFACLKYSCGENPENSSDGIYDRLSSHISRHNVSSERSPVSTISRNNTADRPLIVIEFVNEMADPHEFFSAIDQPPRYDDVVQCDLNGNANVPEIQTSIPETPPPAYEEGDFVRY